MVRAILEGRKTQTRRIIKGARQHFCDFNGLGNPVFTDDGVTYQEIKCPFEAGMRLWVKETACIAPVNFADPDDTCRRDADGKLRYVSYKADGHSEEAMRDYKLKWTPSLFMPRWASRITLEITEVRVERLQEIGEADAKAEGAGSKLVPDYIPPDKCGNYRFYYERIWESIHGPGSWDLNPWVFVVSFRLLEGGPQ
jgi:hypothetical protein